LVPEAKLDARVRPSDAANPVASLQVPATDDGLPGAGPIRRSNWFRQLWLERRAQWLARKALDQGAVVFLGDSITQLWGDDLGKSFAGLRVANRGISGDTSRGVLIRLELDVIALHPRAVVLLIGTNDIEEQAEPDTIAGNVKLVITALEHAQAELPILLCEVFPSSAKMGRPRQEIVAVNQRYAALAHQDPRITLVRTWAIFADADGNAQPSEFPDLLHPNASGYAQWARALRPFLARLN
jgi:lysophospholipase L1-like esterase